MKIKVTIGERSKIVDVADEILADGKSFFDKMDGDMDKGWQMGADYIEKPDQVQRCQIAADRVLDAIGTHNENLKILMLGYILDRVPTISEIVIDTGGELMNTEIIEQRAPIRTTGQVTQGMSRLDALEQANKDVGMVYKVGRSWRFAVFDDNSNEWVESPLMDSKKQTEQIRNKAFESRFRYLLGQD
ncbi:MAG: hypothetical protein ACC641_07080 [Acidiferrobacterales bacterium]